MAFGRRWRYRWTLGSIRSSTTFDELVAWFRDRGIHAWVSGPYFDYGFVQTLNSFALYEYDRPED